MRVPASRHSGMLLAVAGMLLALLVVACGKTPPPAPAPSPKKLTIAAAASLRFALPEIIAAFQKANKGATVEGVYGSSGSLSSQIAANAPFDIFLSADESYAIGLVKARHGIGGSIIRYATGRVAIWVPKDSPLDVSKGYAILADPSVKKIAIANPKLAPYGVAAEEALRRAGVYDSVKDRFVLAENISQATQFVESGSAQAGLLALSMVVSPGMKDKGRFWSVPEGDHAPIIQSGCICAATKDQALAERFMSFLQSEAAQEILRRNGFGIPGE